jgi:hypothetical protein
MNTSAAKPVAMENTEKLEIADIFRSYGDDYRQSRSVSHEQAKVMRHIEICRTARLGGHLEQCDHCAFERISYNSCRDRHCPKCQALVKERWLNDRKAELLPCGYFHLVFTLPHDLNPIILCNKRVTLNILFAAANGTLQSFARDSQWRLEGQLGMIAILHTWSQTLIDHFHLHCIIPAGALSPTRDKWIPSRATYLFGIGSLAKEFRRRYLRAFARAYRKAQLIFPGKTAALGTDQKIDRLIESLSKTKWVAYAKRPFAGPEQVLDYLGRYTHRVAISNNRILSANDGKVVFTYRDRSKDNALRTMTLSANEFIRRFLLHVLPKGFMKIRYFGFLAHTNKTKAIPLLRKLIDGNAELPVKTDETIVEMMLRLTGTDITCCPKCGKGKMKLLNKLPQWPGHSP